VDAPIPSLATINQYLTYHSRWHSELLFVYLSLMKFDHPILPLLGRLLMSYIFLTSGLAKVFSWEGNVQYMSTRYLPAIPVLLALAAVIELGGTICLITGYQSRVAALVMFGYMIVLTLIFHNYWSIPGNMAGMQETQFRKNLAIAGGLLMLAYSGPGRWSLGRK
jgi:putative oxidoreductase